MYILIIILLVLASLIIIKYNKFITLKERASNAWAQVDVQLKRRYDLIPNLVNTVQGYADHEKETFEKITEARSKAINASSVSEQGKAETELNNTLKSLFAVAESYPELKANENFRELQQELSKTEGKIAYARQFYNDIVQKYNVTIKMFPNRIIADFFKFKDIDYFNLDGEERQRTNIEVKFS